jgi:hypothetical protein
VSYENRKLAVLFLQGRADFVHRNYRFECRRRISFVAADAVMTVPAKMVTTDTEAIALYVAAGNPREDWNALDDRDRWPWRKMALEEWSRHEDSNPGPAVYKTAALPTELQRRKTGPSQP